MAPKIDEARVIGHPLRLPILSHVGSLIPFIPDGVKPRPSGLEVTHILKNI
jgi:hypothetical protein